ncbi:MAG: magnesium chelatase [Planctomycetaceae bacterium]|jgi:magnesium chelatase subunit I|nr:magnesium chelatase [Phycisphaerales bacterium]MCE2651963.1 magnesium chelatase [Planctomycetaceae bacterium]
MANNPHSSPHRPRTVEELLASGWRSRPVKAELRSNLVAALRRGEDLFPGMVGYEATVIPELINAVLAGHDILFLGEKGQGKSRLMRLLARHLDAELPYLDIPAGYEGGCPIHEDPTRPITRAGKAFLAEHGDRAPIAWWPRAARYAERLAPGTKFADLIGEIDPAKLASGVSMGAEDALHFGLIPRMHRGIFAMNELPDLDDLVQVGLFNILEERDVQIRGFPVSFDIDVLVLFSANPSTYNRSGKVIPQLKDRIGSTIQTHYPLQRDLAIEITASESEVELEGEDPVQVPRFMRELVEQMAMCARTSPYVDHQSGVSARFSLAAFNTMVASARQRGIRLGEKPAVCRMSDLAHFPAAALGKLELDLMGSHQLSERQVLEAIAAEAVKVVFSEYVTKHGLEEIAQGFAKGVKLEVGDMLPSSNYQALLARVPAVWDKAFEVNASGNPAVRASCVEFVLAGLHATDRLSRAVRHGRIHYQF